MIREDKNLVLKDLCARLPYGVVVQEPDFYEAPLNIPTLSEFFYEGLEIKPYLRPMSSMTEEEKDDYNSKFEGRGFSWGVYYGSTDWLNAHHFDYRGLIEKGLALEAPEGMYKTE